MEPGRSSSGLELPPVEISLQCSQRARGSCHLWGPMLEQRLESCSLWKATHGQLRKDGTHERDRCGAVAESDEGGVVETKGLFEERCELMTTMCICRMILEVGWCQEASATVLP